MDEFREGFSNKDENSFIREVFEGGITVNTLFKKPSKKLYMATARQLNTGLDLAFKFSDNVDKALRLELEENIFIFSGAKTYQQVREYSSLILDGKKLRTFSEFRKLVKTRMADYNEAYLKAEFDTAIGQAQTAVKWQDIEKQAKLFPYLQRRAVMDANTSPECVILNGIIAPVGDAFWTTRSPLTHFNCRCILTQIDKYTDVQVSSRSQIDKVIKDTDHINPIFKGNPGIDKVIFNETHPYFDVAKGDKELAKRNFNLPIKK